MSIEFMTIKIENHELKVEIKRKKIKNTYIRIKDETICVSAHPFVSKQTIIDLIYKNEEKIIAQLKKQAYTEVKQSQLYHFGKQLIVRTEQAKKLTYVWNGHNEIHFYKRAQDTLDDCFHFFYKQEATIHLPAIFEMCFHQFKLKYNKQMPELAIRKMKSRYGTCYYKRNKVVLNQSLIRYERCYIEFVIYHELSHLIHPNHSKDFYNVLAQFVPNHKILRKEINKL